MVIRIFEMFAGYGGASWALKKANIFYECVGFSEIEKSAIQIYVRNFPSIRNFGDCTKIQASELPNFDILTGGFPCQAFSMAGKRRGFNEARGTLFYDIVRIAKEKKPKYMLLENVEGLISHNEGETFKVIAKCIKQLGYGIAYKVLNSLDYGIPQYRKRLWIVCKLGGWDFLEFNFPCSQKLSHSWHRYLDDPKNYIKVKKTPSRDKMRHLCANITNRRHVYTITTKQDRYPNAGIVDFEDYYRFLTPIECFRLMGFVNDEINIKGLSISNAYKLAGNGWEINLASKILKNMLKYEVENETR